MTRGMISALRDLAASRSSQPALMAPGRPFLSHGALVGAIERIAALLPQGGHIATLLPPGPESALLALAAMQSGVVLPLNPESTGHDLAIALDRLKPDLLVTAAGLPGDGMVIARTRGLALAVATADHSIGDLSLAIEPGTTPERLALPPQTRMLLQTSGTTALPKLVPLTETNLMAAATALGRSLALGPDDRALNLLPQFHIGGLWDLVAAPLLAGGSVIFGGSYSRRAFAAGMELAPTWVQLAPPMIADLLTDPDQGPLDLRFIRSVSAALPAALRRDAEARLAVPVIEIYGMTETAGVITSQPPDRQDGSVGLPVGPQVSIRAGEIIVQGDQVSPGYLLADAEESARFGPDGFRTGDLGRFDAMGQLWITGRAKDLINRGGEMVAPAEVEEALRTLPWIGDSAVFALPHPTLGEEIAAAIVVADPPEDAEAVARHAVRRLLGHGRMPASVHIVDAIPRSAGGKLLRRLLSERFAAGQSLSVQAKSAVALTPVGDWVAAVLASVLGRPAIGGGDDFFLLGGTSLQAAQAIALMQERFPDAILYVSSLYEASSPAAFESFLAESYPALCAAILRDSGPPIPAVTPLTQAEQAIFDASLRCPAPPAIGGAPNDKAVFILSAPRSGSTLLRVMLAGNPALFAPPELYLLPFRDLAARRDWFGQAHRSQLEGLPRALMEATGIAVDAALAATQKGEADARPVSEVLRDLQKVVAPRLLVEKTPFNAVHRETLDAMAALFPDAHYIHLTRHPYGMINSFLQAHMEQLWWPRLTGPDGPTLPLSAQHLAELLWTRIAETTVAFLHEIPAERQIHLRYESLVAEPEGQMLRLCKWLGIAYDPAMCAPHDKGRQRMTDGLHAGSRMIGDPKFHRHSGVSQASASLWRSKFSDDFLAPRTFASAAGLGHGQRLHEERAFVSFEL